MASTSDIFAQGGWTACAIRVSRLALPEPPTNQVAAWRMRDLISTCPLCVVIAGSLVSQIWTQTVDRGLAISLATIETARKVRQVVFLVLQALVVFSHILPARTICIAAGAVFGLISGSTLAATDVLIHAFSYHLRLRDYWRGCLLHESPMQRG